MTSPASCMFYERGRGDAELGPVFAGAVACARRWASTTVSRVSARESAAARLHRQRTYCTWRCSTLAL